MLNTAHDMMMSPLSSSFQGRTLAPKNQRLFLVKFWQQRIQQKYPAIIWKAGVGLQIPFLFFLYAQLLLKQFCAPRKSQTFLTLHFDGTKIVSQGGAFIDPLRQKRSEIISVFSQGWSQLPVRHASTARILGSERLFHWHTRHNPLCLDTQKRTSYHFTRTGVGRGNILWTYELCALHPAEAINTFCRNIDKNR